MPAKPRAMYSRGDIRAATGYSDTSLDRLEDAGVVSPMRTPSGRRVYTEVDVAALRAHREKSRPRRRSA